MTGGVSVVVPVFDGARYLAEALESALGQTRPAAEVIVIDDGSTDETRAVAERFPAPVAYVHQAHAGQGAALNRGVARAGGAYLAFLDADDLWTPDKLARQVQVLEGQPDLDAVFGEIEQFVSPELVAAGEPAPRSPAQPAYMAGTMLVRAPAFRQVGPFEPRWAIGGFLEWYLRAQEAGFRDVLLPGIVMRRRLHRDNVGIRERAQRGDYARILKLALDRRRAAAGGDAPRPDR